MVEEKIKGSWYSPTVSCQKRDFNIWEFTFLVNILNIFY